MKNRKAPVMLFGLVVIAVGAMTIFNALQKPQSPEAQEQQKEEAVADRKMTDQDRAAVDKGLLDTLGKSKAEKTGKPLAASQADIANEPAKEPTIFLRTTSSFRPLPNDASPNTHWYEKSSRSAQKAEENAKGQG